MKKQFLRSVVLAVFAMSMPWAFFTSCSDPGEEGYVLKKEDISFSVSGTDLSAVINRVFRIEVQSVSDEGVEYLWKVDGKDVSDKKNLEYTFDREDEYAVVLTVSQRGVEFDFPFTVTASASYHLKKDDIKIQEPEGGFNAKVDQLFKVTVSSISDDGVSYRWFIDGEAAAQTKNFEHTFVRAGKHVMTLTASQNEVSFDYEFTLTVGYEGIKPPVGKVTAYVTRVLDYVPAAGQFTNQMPEYTLGDTQEDMNRKVLESIGNNNRGMISLGGYGGYVVVGFDHTIENVRGKMDFRVLGNAFYSDFNPDPDASVGGSCEAGIIMVAYDANSNGVPDDNEWYEIAGSAHADHQKEPWYEKAKEAGCDVNFYSDYQMTYHRPAQEPEEEGWETYIRWEDNKGNSGYVAKNQQHEQSWYPSWIDSDKLTFSGTRLPQNAIQESKGGTPYYVLYKFRYGYADNELNNKDLSAIDIDWAVNEKGQAVNLPGVDFIKIYTGVRQYNGWLGECSTEITGVEDLHVLEVDIDTPVEARQ